MADRSPSSVRPSRSAKERADVAHCCPTFWFSNVIMRSTPDVVERLLASQYSMPSWKAAQIVSIRWHHVSMTINMCACFPVLHEIDVSLPYAFFPPSLMFMIISIDGYLVRGSTLDTTSCAQALLFYWRSFHLRFKFLYPRCGTEISVSMYFLISNAVSSCEVWVP
ncbi:hypothetical protein BC827DRAFT_503671 [Russula dissimulans]|nr:hypothetical protein BC827DRAFT_503671 [Russula dissimulans]